MQKDKERPVFLEPDEEIQAKISNWLVEHKYKFMIQDNGRAFKIYISDGGFVILVAPPKNNPTIPIWLLALPNFWPVPVANVDIANDACCVTMAKELLVKVFPQYDDEDRVYYMHAAVEAVAKTPEDFLGYFSEFLDSISQTHNSFFRTYVELTIKAGRSPENILIGVPMEARQMILQSIINKREFSDLVEFDKFLDSLK